MLREVVLGLFGGKRKVSRLNVAVCQDVTTITVAGIERDQNGAAKLQFAKRELCSSAEERSQALGLLLQGENTQKQKAVAVLPVNAYQLTQVEMADLPEEELRDAARWQISERIDYPPDEAVVDLYAVPPFAGEKRPQTYVVSAQERLLRERLEALAANDLATEVIDIPEFALRNVCDLYKDDDRGVALLLLLEKRGVLVIVRDGVLYLVRWLNTGMEDLTPYAEGNLEALSEQLDSIVLEIQRSFDYCESSFHLPLVSRLLVAQTQLEIPAVINYLNDYLSTKVSAFDFADIMTVPEGSEQVELNQYLFAIGGALRQENNDASAN